MQRTTIFALAAGISALSLLIPIAHAGDAMVNCHAPGPNGKIASVLSRLDPQATNVVRVKGHCKENLVIKNFAQLSLIAERDAVIEDASNGQLPVVEIWYSPYVLIQGFTIQGGQNGLFCRAFSFCRFVGDTVEQTKAGAGILIGSAEARMEDIVVRDTADMGIQVVQSKVAAATNISISDTGGVGLMMQNASWFGQLTIQRAGTDGVYAESSSHLTSPVSVTGAGRNGIWIARGSSADLFGMNIADNHGTGVVAHLTSTVTLGNGTITGNMGGGIVLQFQSSSFINGASITNNQGTGLFIDQVSYSLVLAGFFGGHSDGDIVCGPQVAQVNVDPTVQLTSPNRLLCPTPPAGASIKPRF